MNLSQIFQTRIIPALRAKYGEAEVTASGVSAVNSICGNIVRPGNDANIVFRITEDNFGIVLALGVLRTDVMNQSCYIEDPLLIYDLICDYVEEWEGVESSGRMGTREEYYEKNKGTLTSVKPSEVDGLDDIKAASSFEDEAEETKILELV